MPAADDAGDATDKYAPQHPQGWNETLAYIKRVLEEAKVEAATPITATTPLRHTRTGMEKLLKLMEWTKKNTTWEVTNSPRQLTLVCGYVAESNEFVPVEDAEAVLYLIGSFAARLEAFRLLLPRLVGTNKFSLLAAFENSSERSKAEQLLRESMTPKRRRWWYWWKRRHK